MVHRKSHPVREHGDHEFDRVTGTAVLNIAKGKLYGCEEKPIKGK